MIRKGKRKIRLPEGDDGRTIASMNVEGMPWYTPEKAGEKEQGGPETGEKPGARREESPLSKEEARYYTWGALKAALLVTLVLCGGIVLFVLFCQFVWFR